jgi:acyl carrier protein
LNCKEKVQISFRKGLALPRGFDVTEANSSTLPQWDSVAHLQLVVALEDAFNISLTPADVVELKSYASALEILRRHGVSIDG